MEIEFSYEFVRQNLHSYEFRSPPWRNRANLRSSPFHPVEKGYARTSHTFIYLAVVFGLLVIPRALQRFRLPAPLTCFAFGIIVAGFFKPLIHDSVISYLSTLGIAALFLFAGLEVDLAELRRQLAIPGRRTSRSAAWCWWLALALPPCTFTLAGRSTA